MSILFTYQIGAMIICFVQKHQSIAGALKKYEIPKPLIIFMALYFSIFVTSVPCVFSTLNVPEDQKIDYIQIVTLDIFDLF
ncbi:Protein CBG19547 [Caenorhabditis briggsae]|uniref:Protein CBG19547 n=1 Tax=Caenorhabditis briggsae TaxID=6238 RepID=A8XVV4_CAEBR|nr:Protein CBG19547 [Caenorhabditis briggsae]CAP36773.2 Protein CBG19547 [Caenorhabditis briggsae]